jgi:hypothetical protein
MAERVVVGSRSFEGLSTRAGKGKLPKAPLVATHGRSVVGASGGVAVQGGVHFEPLEHQEFLQLERYPCCLRDKVFGDEDFGALVSQQFVQLQVGFAGVGVDRHFCVAASADGGEIVEGDRPAKVTDVISGFVRHQDLQSIFLELCVGRQYGFARALTVLAPVMDFDACSNESARPVYFPNAPSARSDDTRSSE